MRILRTALALLLVFLLLPAAAEEAAAVTQGDYSYTVWAGWTGETDNPEVYTFFRDPSEPTRGYLNVQVRTEDIFGEIAAEEREETLQTVLDYLAKTDGFDDPETTFGTWGGHEGMMFTVRYMKRMNAAGFITYHGKSVCWILLADEEAGTAELTEQLAGLLGTLKYTGAE